MANSHKTVNVAYIYTNFLNVRNRSYIFLYKVYIFKESFLATFNKSVLYSSFYKMFHEYTKGDNNAYR